jgi:uncharacterized protein (DUF362 family)
MVAILKATYGSAEEQIRAALRLLGYEPRRKQLLLKPNLLTSARWLPLGGVHRSAHTDVRFIEALLRVFDGYEIVIAEGAMATSKRFVSTKSSTCTKRSAPWRMPCSRR